MVKILKNKKRITASENDKWTIRLLRQEVYCLEQQYHLNVLTKQEYEDGLKGVSMKLNLLENKYYGNN